MGEKIWLIIGGMAIVTFVPRVIPFIIIKGEKLPAPVKEWLRLLPIVIFASMVAPPLLTEGTKLAPSQHLGEIVVVLAGAATAHFTQKVPLSLGAAVIALFLINFMKLN